MTKLPVAESNTRKTEKLFLNVSRNISNTNKIYHQNQSSKKKTFTQS